jgi:hypothetical protein
MTLMVELIDHWKMEEVRDEIELIVKDFELILMVLVYDEFYDEMILMLMIDEHEVMCVDLIDLFVVMNVEMN